MSNSTIDEKALAFAYRITGVEGCSYLHFLQAYKSYKPNPRAAYESAKPKWWWCMPSHIRSIWDTFTLDQQQALFIWADHLADRPEPEDVSELMEALETISNHNPEGGSHAETINVAIAALERRRKGLPQKDCAICGEDHEGSVPLTCATGDGV